MKQLSFEKNQKTSFEKAQANVRKIGNEADNQLVRSDEIQPKEKRAIIIAEVDIEQQARDMAEEKLLSSKTELKGFRGFFKKIWQHNLAHEYYRQKEIEKARREIWRSGNLYVGEAGEKVDHENAMAAIVQRLGAELGSEDLLRKGEEKRVLKKDDFGAAELKHGISDLIRRFSGGNLTEEQFQAEKNMLYSQHVSDQNNSGSVFADNLLEIAKQVKEGVLHGQGLDALDEDFEIILGKARTGVETEVQYSAVDRIIEKIKKNSAGKILSCFVNEATVASAVAIAYGFGMKGMLNATQRAAKWVGPVGMGISAGIGGAVSGVRENKRIKEERSWHAREMAKGGKTIEAGSRRREELEKFRYETKNAAELTSNLRKSLEGLRTNPNEQKLKETLTNLTEIRSRLAFSEQEKIDLISFSDSKKVEKERAEMYIAAAEAKVFLKKNIQASWAIFYENEQGLNDYLQNSQEIKIEDCFLREKTLKDEAFNKMKRKKVAWAVAKGLGVGLGMGMLAQEAQAYLGGGNEGLLTETGNTSRDHHYTAMAYLKHYISNDPSEINFGQMHDILIGNGANVKLPENMDLVGNPDGSFDIIQKGTGEAIAGGLKFTPEGALAEESQKILMEKGVFPESLVRYVDEAMPGGTKTIGTKDFIKDHENLFSKIKRGAWADNNTPKPDANELKLWWGGAMGSGVDVNGNYVFNIKHMTQGGSFHTGKNWDPQSLMKEGKMKLLLSLSRDTQNQVVEISIDANGNAIIDPNSEIGKIAFEIIGGHAKFLGKFAEVAVMGESADGIDHVNILATHVGAGIKESIETGVPSVNAVVKGVHTTIFNMPINPSNDDFDYPYVIPMVSRKPLEQLEKREENPPFSSPYDEYPLEKRENLKENQDLYESFIGAVSVAALAKEKEDVPVEQQQKIAGLLGALEISKEQQVKDARSVEKKDGPARSAAMHTIHKLDKYEDINAATLGEADEKFIALTRRLWDELTIHGREVNGVLKKQADLDAYSCLKLVELAGIDVDMNKVNFVKQGGISDSGVVMDTSNKQHGVIAEDGGKRLIIDHHGEESDRETSATKFVYETLVEMGLLKKEAYLDSFVGFVTQCDNFNFTLNEMTELNKNYSKNLYGLAFRMKTEDVLELFKNGADPMADLPADYLDSHTYTNPNNGKEEKLSQLSMQMQNQMKNGERALGNVEKAGFVVDTGVDRFGKVLIDTKKTSSSGKWYPKVNGENNSNQMAVFLRGYGAYLIWSPSENSFVLYTQKKMDENSLAGGFSQGFNIRGNMWMKPQQDQGELSVTLEEIFSKLSGQPFKLEGDLEKKLNGDAGAKEMMRVIGENKLTESILRETAKRLNISLKDLLLESMRQDDRVISSFFKKTKAENKNSKYYNQKIEQLAIDALLKYQLKC